MRRLVLLLLLFVLPCAWAAPTLAGLQTVCCAGEAEVAAPAPVLASTDQATPCADCCQGCGGEGAPCGVDCPCQGHTPPLSALHHRPAPLGSCAAQAFATDQRLGVPDPFSATPLRPPSAR